MKYAEKKQIKTKVKHVVWQQFDLKTQEIWTTAKFFSHKSILNKMLNIKQKRRGIQKKTRMK